MFEVLAKCIGCRILHEVYELRPEDEFLVTVYFAWFSM